VVAVVPSSFGSFVTASAGLVSRKPASLSFDEAATIPIAFITAVYALRHLSQLSEGDRILIHSASGGVGLAAVQIAQQVGAEIFATAGSPEKRAFLESLGVPHVMDSRSTAFADEVMARTDGKGVDVVLNSLAGEGMLKSLDVLAPFGRFLEIGKRDIYENRELGLAPFKKQLSYFSIDLERLFGERPAVGVKLFREVMQGFETGVFKPLRLQVFPITEAVHAFREMAQAKHIGKIVVSLGDSEQKKTPAPEADVVLRGDQTYVITGGLGALGLAVVTWMVEHGARHIALLGRSEPSAAARATLTALEQRGVSVAVVQADVAQRDQVSKALAQIDRTMPAVSGIIHAAGIQDDGVLLHQTRERFRTVMAPKVAGAWNLHTLTADRKLDFFVLFSSAASLIGSPGQANYAAANAFLDALAHYRRALGMPALSINWGAWSQVGLAARMGSDDRVAQLGMSITPRQGLNMLGRVINQRAAQVGVMRVELSRWQQLFPTVADWPFLEDLAREEMASGHLRSHDSVLRKTLMALPTGQHRRAMLQSRLQEDLARTLRVNAGQVGLTEPLQSFGLDSLSAVELRNRWAEELGLVLSATLVWDHPTISALSAYLADQLEAPSERVEADEASRSAPPKDHAAVVAQINELSEAEAEALLLQKLSRIEAGR
jgi:phthiocerol/phenolphthiocerol synthesis type-I polyketide synthase C